ncbi:hypothetical protein BpHYR1_005357 [Brachionus plicatilis]|uniref:Uncharacterized protein n=1 Tax=Brachionus plicatilis TaxID=10195 RepID=A0A3M7R563_BRAPC|nr:hypothetical protein BpHYR1_005357 [Brachionus plicatilis]
MVDVPLKWLKSTWSTSVTRPFSIACLASASLICDFSLLLCVRLGAIESGRLESRLVGLSWLAVGHQRVVLDVADRKYQVARVAHVVVGVEWQIKKKVSPIDAQLCELDDQSDFG